jgi:hypoxanthine-guanine phosphoribosyltransferase
MRERFPVDDQFISPHGDLDFNEYEDFLLEVLHDKNRKYIEEKAEDIMPIIEALTASLENRGAKLEDVSGCIFLPTGTDSFERIIKTFFSELKLYPEFTEVLVDRDRMASEQSQKLQEFIEITLSNEEDIVLIFDDTLYSGATISTVLSEINSFAKKSVIGVILNEDDEGQAHNLNESELGEAEIIVGDTPYLNRFASRRLGRNAKVKPEFKLMQRLKSQQQIIHFL